jgi:hypothetical protein
MSLYRAIDAMALKCAETPNWFRQTHFRMERVGYQNRSRTSEEVSHVHENRSLAKIEQGIHKCALNESLILIDENDVIVEDCDRDSGIVLFHPTSQTLVIH